MKIYVIDVITRSNPPIHKISQDGFQTFEEAREWCRNRQDVVEEAENGWKFISDKYEYCIIEVLVK